MHGIIKNTKKVSGIIGKFTKMPWLEPLLFLINIKNNF